MAEENAGKPAKPEGATAEKEGAEKQPEKAGGNKSLIIVIAIGVLVMTITPAITFFIVKQATKSPSTEEASGEEKKSGGHGAKTEEKKSGGHGEEKKSGGHGEGKGGEAGDNSVLPLKAIIVNIAETKATRLLKFEPHLVLSESKLGDELKKPAYTALLTDKVSMAAGRKTLDELEGAQGRETLKREIMSEVNAAIKDKLSGAVIDVYFNEYLIQ